MTGDVADELDDVSEVVLVAGVVLARVRLEEVVAGGQREGHAGRGPDVGGGAVPRSEEDLQRAVLAGLDVLSEVMVL